MAAVAVRPETRAIVALGYPFWPLAIIALLDSKASYFVKRQAWQALGFNAGMYGLGTLLTAAAAIPILSFGAWPLLPFIVPVFIVASIVYAIKVWQGDDVDVPLVSDWVDARLPASSPQGQS
jgi:4-hydroxybenzoate polyprenyltransferase